jgi:hypothetical protein
MTQTATPLIGLGAALSIGTQGGSPTYTVVNGVKSVKLPDGKFGTEDVTVLGTSGYSRRFIKTLEEAGEVDVSMLWESADPGQAELLTAYATIENSTNGSKFPFKGALLINAPGGQVSTGDTFTFSAMVIGFKRPEVQPDKTIMWGVTLKVDGAVTLADGS